MPSLDTLTDEWDASLHDVTDGTRTVYRRAVRHFRQFLAATHPDVTRPGHIKRLHVDEWMTSRAGNAQSTRRRDLIAVRLWLEYLRNVKGSGAKSNPADRVRLPHVEMQPVPTVHDEDLRAVLRTLGGDTFLQTRDAAIVLLLVDTGMRRNELCQIDISDLDKRNREIILRQTKNHQDRVVVVSGKKAWYALLRYMRHREAHPQATRETALFLGTRPRKSYGYRMSGNAVGEMLKRKCRAAGVRQIRPHQLRHTHFGILADKGTPDSVMRTLGGWRSEGMVRRYTAHHEAERARDHVRRLAVSDRL